MRTIGVRELQANGSRVLLRGRLPHRGRYQAVHTPFQCLAPRKTDVDVCSIQPQLELLSSAAHRTPLFPQLGLLPGNTSGLLKVSEMVGNAG